MEELEALLKSTKIDYIYVMTNFQSPTGYKWSKDKKKKLLELADKYGVESVTIAQLGGKECGKCHY